MSGRVKPVSRARCRSRDCPFLLAFAFPRSSGGQSPSQARHSAGRPRLAGGESFPDTFSVQTGDVNRRARLLTPGIVQAVGVDAGEAELVYPITAALAEASSPATGNAIRPGVPAGLPSVSRCWARMVLNALTTG